LLLTLHERFPLKKIKAVTMDNFFSHVKRGGMRKSFDLKNTKITLIVNVNAENEGRNQWQDSIFPLILPSCSHHCDDDK
jgi:hypothetical protein